jgi:hypothetical protein
MSEMPVGRVLGLFYFAGNTFEGAGILPVLRGDARTASSAVLNSAPVLFFTFLK